VLWTAAKNLRDLTAIERVSEVRVAVVGVDSNVINQHASGETRSRRTRSNIDVNTAYNSALVRTSRMSDWVHIKVELKKIVRNDPEELLSNKGAAGLKPEREVSGKSRSQRRHRKWM
jgi:hypothetical protein